MNGNIFVNPDSETALAIGAIDVSDVLHVRKIRIPQETRDKLARYMKSRPPRQEHCQCEHVSHFDENAQGDPDLRTDHEYYAPMTSWQMAWFVGPVCDHCAATHMKDLLRKQYQEGRDG